VRAFLPIGGLIMGIKVDIIARLGQAPIVQSEIIAGEKSSVVVFSDTPTESVTRPRLLSCMREGKYPVGYNKDGKLVGKYQCREALMSYGMPLAEANSILNELMA